MGAIFDAARRQALPWVQDLAFPALGVIEEVDRAAQSAPTLPPAALADPDSFFAQLPPAAGGVRLHYKEAPAPSGSPGAPTILLIHGFNGSTFSWRANLRQLADATGARVIAFDRPPFGLSDRPLAWGATGQLPYNPYELDGSVSLTEELLQALDVTGPVAAVGHSAGALVALELAKRRPQQVQALCLVAPAVPTTPENSLLRRATFGSQLRFLATRAVLATDAAGLRYVRRQLLKQADRVAAGDLGFRPHPSTASSAGSLDADAAVDALSSADQVAQWEAAAEAAAREAAEGYTRPLRAENWDRAALLNLRAFSLPSVYDYAAVDGMPVMVVTGDEDGALTPNARALADLLRERRRGVEGADAPVVFREMGCAHVPMEELPAEFNAAVGDFLRVHLPSV